MFCNSTTGSSTSDVIPVISLTIGVACPFWAVAVTDFKPVNNASVTEKTTEVFMNPFQRGCVYADKQLDPAYSLCVAVIDIGAGQLADPSDVAFGDPNHLLTDVCRELIASEYEEI